jgi:sensor histidine kinase YesM
MKEKISSPIDLRPRFSIELNEDTEIVVQKFKNALLEGNDRFPAKFADGHIIVDVPEKEGHFWSPQLNIEIESIGENKSLLKGLLGPKPQVWTLFMFVHFVVGISIAFFSVLFYVRWSLEDNYVMPLVMLIFLPMLWVLLYFLGRIGKSSGHMQMDDLHDLMTNILKN